MEVRNWSFGWLRINNGKKKLEIGELVSNFRFEFSITNIYFPDN